MGTVVPLYLPQEEVINNGTARAVHRIYIREKVGASLQRSKPYACDISIHLVFVISLVLCDKLGIVRCFLAVRHMA